MTLANLSCQGITPVENERLKICVRGDVRGSQKVFTIFGDTSSYPALESFKPFKNELTSLQEIGCRKKESVHEFIKQSLWEELESGIDFATLGPTFIK